MVDHPRRTDPPHTTVDGGSTSPTPSDRRTGSDAPGERIAVVVPHTHWDREWYAPFETMRFHLLAFLDHLLSELEADPDLVFLLDGQTVMVSDYLQVRPHEADRIARRVASGQLRVGPCFVQPDEFHVSGESLVRNFLIGCQDATELGRVMREGYLPDTFGHVHQLPQVLQGFGIDTFYAMRGLGEHPTLDDDEFWWEAPDGSRVRVTWLSESYSNAAVLTDDPDTLAIQHGALVAYDSLADLLDRLDARSPSRVLLLLNGGDHLLVQADVPGMVAGLDAASPTAVRLGGLEEFASLVEQRPAPTTVVTGELRAGRRHDVFDGIGSTRTPMKVAHARLESRITGLAERLDALATIADGRSNLDSLRHLWRELVKNHAHDSICGCSVDEVHDEMATRFTTITQAVDAVVDDSLARLTRAAAGPMSSDEVAVVVVNPSAFCRTGSVEVDVVPDLDAPLGERRFGWTQGPGVCWSDWDLVDDHGEVVAARVVPGRGVTVRDVLVRRKEVVADTLRFVATDVPAMGTRRYRLVATSQAPGSIRAEEPGDAPATASQRCVANDHVAVEFAADGTLTVTDRRTGRSMSGLCELLDDGDDGDEYGFGPMGDQPLTSRAADWSVRSMSSGRLRATASLAVPARRSAGTGARTDDTVELGLSLTVGLTPSSDRVDVALEVDNTATDHRLRLRVPTGWPVTSAVTESAFGVLHRPIVAQAGPPDDRDWHDPPTGVGAVRRFVVVRDDDGDLDTGGLQLLAEGLHEYRLTPDGDLDLTVLRSVGWLARMDHPRRDHKIGPELATPGAQCPGRHVFRLALRLTGRADDVGSWYRHAEEFSVPLQAVAVQGRVDHAGGAPGTDRIALGSGSDGLAGGLEVAPATVVLSALKTAEDGRDVVVRLFNADDSPHAAVIQTSFPVSAAWACDLQEAPRAELDATSDTGVTVPMRRGEIVTVRLRTAITEPNEASS